MERRRAERIAWAISGCSFLAAMGVLGAYLLGWRPEVSFVAALFLILLLVWLLGMVAAITLSENGWPEDTRTQWVAAFVINPVLAAIMFRDSRKSPEERGIDPDDHETLSKL